MKRYRDSFNNKTEYLISLRKKENRGAAMIVAIIVVAILMVFSFSLLLVSYTLYASQNKKVASKKNSEAANTLSVAMRRELTDEEAFVNSDLWIYLRCHLLQDDWTFYEPSLDGHKEAQAVKSFEMKANPNYYRDAQGKSTIDGYPGLIKLKVYWMLPAELYKEKKAEGDDELSFLTALSLSALRNNTITDSTGDITSKYKMGIRLFVEITCESASQSYTVKNEYHLTYGPFVESDEYQSREKKLLPNYIGKTTGETVSDPYDSKDCDVNVNEHWGWVYDGSE